MYYLNIYICETVRDFREGNGTTSRGRDQKQAAATLCVQPVDVLVLIRSDEADAERVAAFENELDSAIHPGIFLLVLSIIEFLCSLSLSRGPFKAMTDSEAIAAGEDEDGQVAQNTNDNDNNGKGSKENVKNKKEVP